MNRSHGGLVSSSSAVFLGVTGLAMLFAADNLLPLVIPGYPATGEWIGQLLGGAWLSVAALNWLNISALIGGIYSRGVTSANAVLYFTSALSLVRPLLRGKIPAWGWILFFPFAAFASIYVWLLFRGPFAHDLQQHAKLPR